jgi:ribonucleoside-diphosphate reductase beta chain
MAESSDDCFELFAEDTRITIEPIYRNNLWNLYTEAKNSFWDSTEVNLAEDKYHYNTRLNFNERETLNKVLAFFASIDGFVNENISQRFKQDVPFMEAAYFYDFQMMIENIHAEVYAKLIESIIESSQERDRLFQIVKTSPTISRMYQYVRDCIDSNSPFPMRLVRMLCVEGIFFTGSFCIIFWIQQRGIMYGLTFSNELIRRDEWLHTKFAAELYNMVKPTHRLSRDQILTEIERAVEIACKFIEEECLPVPHINMNASLMTQYIKFQTDRILELINEKPLYNVAIPFDFMKQIDYKNQTNFFERRVSEYNRAGRIVNYEKGKLILDYNI